MSGGAQQHGEVAEDVMLALSTWACGGAKDWNDR